MVAGKKEGVEGGWAKDLILPKKIIFKPGFIYNSFSKRYGFSIEPKRMIFYFENNIVDLQKACIERYGLEKTKELFYEVGKEQIWRYMELSKAKKIPTFILLPMLKYILKGAKMGGATGINEFSYSVLDKSLKISGRDNVFCRKSKVGSYIAGCLAGGMSYITGLKYEAKASCSRCPDGCNFSCSPSKEGTKRSQAEYQKPLKDYHKLNFSSPPQDIRGIDIIKLINFGKVEIRGDNKFYINDNLIVLGEIGWVDIFIDKFYRMGERVFIEEQIKESSRKIAKSILKKDLSVKNNLNLIRDIMIAFGWGKACYKIKRDGIIFELSLIPVSRFGCRYPKLVLQGFIEELCSGKIKEVKAIFSKEKKRLLLFFRFKS